MVTSPCAKAKFATSNDSRTADAAVCAIALPQAAYRRRPPAAATAAAAGVGAASAATPPMPRVVHTRCQLWGAAVPLNVLGAPCVLDGESRCGIAGDWLVRPLALCSSPAVPD